MSGKIVVSQTLYSAAKRDLEKKRRKVAKENAELDEMEASFKMLAPVNLKKAKPKK